MVLIISQSSDVSTDTVMDWLFYKKKECFRVNGDTIFNLNSFTTFELSFHKNVSKITFNENNPIDLNKSISIWHRRDAATPLPKLDEIKNVKLNTNILTHLSIENFEAKKALFSCVKKGKKILGNFDKSSINKIEMLKVASNNNIDIPATIITNSKSDLEKFKNRHDKIITKTIQDCFHFIQVNKDHKEVFLNYTEEVTEKFIEKMAVTFFPSLFQEKLDKELDIRTFFLDGKCYSMAIFSQINAQTSIDVRKSSKTIKNRNVPYQLPRQLEEKIEKLMKDLELNTGSIDFIKTKQGRFVFLEVNPVGQYGMTSYPCNYHLDKKIAEYLIH